MQLASVSKLLTCSEAAEHGRSKRRNQRRIDFLRSTTEIKLSCDRFLGPETDATCPRA